LLAGIQPGQQLRRGSMNSCGHGGKNWPPFSQDRRCQSAITSLAPSTVGIKAAGADRWGLPGGDIKQPMHERDGFAADHYRRQLSVLRN
jgi:hypothetical protein